MISLSASTAQTLEIGCGLSAFSARSPTSSIPTSRYFAARMMKLPDPAAHFSFVLKLRTLPASPSPIARVV